MPGAPSSRANYVQKWMVFSAGCFAKLGWSSTFFSHYWTVLSKNVMEWSPLFLMTLLILVTQGKDRSDDLSVVEIDSKL